MSSPCLRTDSYEISRLIRLSILLLSSSVCALAVGAPAPFPPYLSDGFDYATFTRFDAPMPPKTLIYQSNGFMALQERGFGGQKIIVPVAGSAIPSNSSDRLGERGGPDLRSFSVVAQETS